MCPSHVYEGFRAGGVVTILRDGKPFDHRPSCRVWNHSPTGFEWGYAGSGPAQLALALLLDHVDAHRAVILHQQFKFDVVTRLLRDCFTISSQDVEFWLQQTMAALASPSPLKRD